MKILILTDFSINALNATKFATVAFKENSEFILANVHKEDHAGDFIGESEEAKSEARLKEIADWLVSSYPDIKIKTLTATGTPSELAKRFEERGNADLIVMGTKGKSSIARDLLGSVAVRVSRSTSIPVLTIPAKSIFQGINRIVLAVDFSVYIPDETIFEPLIKIAKFCDARIQIVSIIDENDEKYNAKSITELKRDVFSDVKTTWHFIQGDNPSVALTEFCQDQNADILTVIAKERNFLDRLFNKSVSEEMIKNADLPILTLETQD